METSSFQLSPIPGADDCELALNPIKYNKAVKNRGNLFIKKGDDLANIVQKTMSCNRTKESP